MGNADVGFDRGDIVFSRCTACSLTAQNTYRISNSQAKISWSTTDTYLGTFSTVRHCLSRGIFRAFQDQ